MTDFQINGPGDDEDGGIRLVLNTAVNEGSLMETSGAHSGKVMSVEIGSRTLASLDEQDTRHYVLSRAQALHLADQLFSQALLMPPDA